MRLVVSDKYTYKSAMKVTVITYTEKNELVFLETREYGDYAHQWKNN